MSVSPNPAAEPAADGKKSFPLWGRIAGVIVGLLGVARVVSAFLPHGLAACDASDVQSAVRGAVEKASGVRVVEFSGITTVTRNESSATCAVRVRASDGSNATMTYRLELADGDTNFRVIDVK